jgi:alpha-beta hydrolase superfamily lysophospholipase
MTIPPTVLIYGGLAISVMCFIVLGVRYASQVPAAWRTATNWIGSRTATQADVDADPQVGAVMSLRSLVKRLKEAGATAEQVRTIEDAAWPVIREMEVRT